METPWLLVYLFIIIVAVQCSPASEGLPARKITLQRSRSSVDPDVTFIVSPLH